MDLKVTPNQVREAERNLRERVREAELQINEAQRAADRRIESIRDEYVRRSEAETARRDSSIENQRQKHYEEIRSLQRKHSQQLNQIKRENERELAKLKEHYSQAIYRERKGGSTELTELQQSNQRAREHEAFNRKLELDTQEKLHNARMNEVRERTKTQLERLKAEERARFSALKEKTEEAEVAADEHFRERYASIVGKQENVLTDTYARTREKLDQLRAESALKLDAYQRRNQDPFYRLIEIDADIDETQNAFILRADIPPHEQNNISIAVRGNEIVVSGYRRSEDQLQEDSGKTLKTATFQSFSESFPVSYPIDSRNVQRSYDGSTLTVVFPKLPTYKNRESYQAKGTASLLRAERPTFPRNLPLTEEEQLAVQKAHTQMKKAPRGGGGTLG